MTTGQIRYEKLEMNATVLTEKELLEIDGGNWQIVLGKGADILQIGTNVAGIIVSDGADALNPWTWTDMGVATADLFS